VFGSKGWAHLLGRDTLRVCLDEATPEARRYAPFDIERAELDAFAIAAGGGTPYPISDADMIHGIAALEAVILSAKRDGEEVTIK